MRARRGIHSVWIEQSGRRQTTFPLDSSEDITNSPTPTGSTSPLLSQRRSIKPPRYA
jgi:hypothetical protein